MTPRVALLTWPLGTDQFSQQAPGLAPAATLALAGPAITAAIAVVFGLVAWRLPPTAPAALRAFVDYQLQVNAAIVIFNLLPALPLDGGRAAGSVWPPSWPAISSVPGPASSGCSSSPQPLRSGRQVELSSALDGVTAEAVMSAPGEARRSADGSSRCSAAPTTSAGHWEP